MPGQELSRRALNRALLFDLPGAPRPDPDTPAPVRLVAEFDNLILSHADRTRIISDQARQRLFTRNGIVPGTVLADGFVSGMWRITAARRAAVIRIELFGPVTGQLRDEISREGERLLEFAAAEAETREIRFEPVS